MIGYAITTTPKRFDKERDYFSKINKEKDFTFLYNVEELNGVASANNECIKSMYDAGCDYFVLMDDDTKIKKKGLGKFLIKKHKETGIEHFTIAGKGAKAVSKRMGCTQWDKGAGVMIFCTRKIIDTVGYMNIEYPSKWGHSHIGWSIRVLKSGFMKPFTGWRVSPDGIENYFYSEDIHGDGLHEQNYSKDEKDKAMVLNKKEFIKETTRVNRYYEFSTKSTLHK